MANKGRGRVRGGGGVIRGKSNGRKGGGDVKQKSINRWRSLRGKRKKASGGGIKTVSVETIAKRSMEEISKFNRAPKRQKKKIRQQRSEWERKQDSANDSFFPPPLVSEKSDSTVKDHWKTSMAIQKSRGEYRRGEYLDGDAILPNHGLLISSGKGNAEGPAWFPLPSDGDTSEEKPSVSLKGQNVRCSPSASRSTPMKQEVLERIGRRERRKMRIDAEIDSRVSVAVVSETLVSSPLLSSLLLKQSYACSGHNRDTGKKEGPKEAGIVSLDSVSGGADDNVGRSNSVECQCDFVRKENTDPSTLVPLAASPPIASAKRKKKVEVVEAGEAKIRKMRESQGENYEDFCRRVSLRTSEILRATSQRRVGSRRSQKYAAFLKGRKDKKRKNKSSAYGGGVVDSCHAKMRERDAPKFGDMALGPPVFSCVDHLRSMKKKREAACAQKC